jgi:dienelactone hydrolase
MTTHEERRPVEFESEGATLRGFVVPAAGHPDVPGVVLAHGWTATLEMGLTSFASVFARAGVSAVVYDHRNFGISDGEPRGLISPWVQARGQRDAVRHAADHVVSGPVGLWGDSGSGADALVVAAVEPRVGAVVALNPTLGAELPEPAPEGYLDELAAMLAHGDVEPADEDVAGPLPMVALDPSTSCASPSPQALRWFVEHGGARGSGWENRLTYADPDARMRYEPFWCLDHVDVPVLVTASPVDEIAVADAEVARAGLERVGAPTRLQLTDAGHFGALWPGSRHFHETADAHAQFLVEALAA